MSERLLINQLRELRSVKRAPAVWREQTRERLLSQAEAQAVRPYSVFERLRLGLQQARLSFAPVPLVSTVVAVAVVLTGAVPFSYATQASLPGQALYPVKRAFERVELSLKSTPEAQGVFRLDLAQTRLTELNALPRTQTLAASELLKSYNIEVSFAQAALRSAPISSALAIRYSEQAEALAQQLEGLVVPEYAQAAFTAARTLTDTLGNEALTMLVGAHQSGQNGVQPAVVAQRLESHLTKVAAKLEGVETRVQEFPDSGSTQRVVIESRQAVVPIKEAPRVAKETLSQAKQLIEKKEFTLALQKVQETEDITEKTEAAVEKGEAEKAAPEPQVKGASDDAQVPDASSESTETEAGDAVNEEVKVDVAPDSTDQTLQTPMLRPEP